MKLLKTLLLTFSVSIIFTGSLNAQFLKKLQKSVERGVEKAVLKKTEEVAADKTEQGMDKLLNMEFMNMYDEKFKTGEAVDPSILPDHYGFEWKYTMQINTTQGAISMDYYLSPNAEYFGMKPDLSDQKVTGDMVMVMDVERNVTTMFMDMGDTKMAMPTAIPLDIDAEDTDLDATSEYVFEEIGTKEILGKTCQGFRMENDEMKVVIYSMLDAPVSFNQVFGSDAQKMPKGFDPKWLEKMENSLVMEMTYTDKAKSVNATKMECVALTEETFVISKNDYQFMNFSMPTSDTK
jgi:hypothetical protein